MGRLSPEDFKRYFYSDTHREFIASQPCAACSRPAWRGYNDPHHLKSRGAGGTWRDLVPLCHTHHVQYHKIGHESFERLYVVDLRLVADRLAADPKDDPEF